jgi:hypothetical protein
MTVLLIVLSVLLVGALFLPHPPMVDWEKINEAMQPLPPRYVQELLWEDDAP